MLTLRAAFFCAAFFLTGCQQFTSISINNNHSEQIPLLRCPPNTLLTDQLVAASIHVPLDRLLALKKNRSLSNEDICSIPDAGLKRALNRLDSPKADHPGDWATFRNLQRRSEDGKVKEDGLIKGIEHRKARLKEISIASAAANVEGTASIEAAAPITGIASNQWTSLGPGSVGGRIRSILIDPANTSNMWLGSVAGGIWHSSDAGAAWQPVNDFMGNLSISSLIMDPNNSSVLYAGTGEGFYNIDAVRGVGVFKSTDGGVSWNLLPSTNPTLNSAWYWVNRLAVNPTDGNVILAATNNGIFRTINAGSTWVNVNSTRTLDIRFDPNNGSKAIAGRKDGKIAYSSDGGVTWNVVAVSPTTTARVEVAYAKSQSGVVYASVDSASGEVWRSADGGATWGKQSTPAHLGSQGWYDNTLWVDPADAAHVIVGGLDLWRSTDSGATWTKISNWSNNMYNGYPNVPHADHHCLISDPNYNGTTNRKLYNSNDGGIFRAADITLANQTSGWETLNHGLAITQFYGVAGHTAAGGRIIAGAQDNGTQMTANSGASWKLASGGDGGFCAADSQNDNYLYGEYVYLQIHRTANGGATTSTSIYSGISDANPSLNGSNANFIAPFILDPNDNNRMLAGGLSLWQSLAVKNATPVWTAIKASTGSKISAIAIAEGNSSIAWVGHNNGAVFRAANSLNATPTWIQVGSGTLPARMVNRILIDKDNANTAIVAFGGYNNNNLWKTTTNGSSWTNITGTLPAVPIFSITRHPNSSNWLYAGTEVGLYTSQDGGATWFTSNDGPANVEISEISWLDASSLLIATHGRGIFTTKVTPPITVPGAPLNVSAVRGNGQATVNFSVPASDGGSAILSYTVTSLPGGKTASGTGTSVTVSGLTNGTSYTFSVTATNSIGTSLPSVSSNSVTPATIPGTPTITSVIVGSSQATINFSTPASDGGCLITGYAVFSSTGLAAADTLPPITITGLNNGVPVTFSVSANNCVGFGSASSVSNPVTPGLVRNSGFASSGYQTLQAAYDANTHTSEIQILGGAAAGPFVKGVSDTVTIKGGYDTSFSSSSGPPAILGTVLLNNGTTVFESIIIK